MLRPTPPELLVVVRAQNKTKRARDIYSILVSMSSKTRDADELQRIDEAIKWLRREQNWPDPKPHDSPRPVIEVRGERRSADPGTEIALRRHKVMTHRPKAAGSNVDVMKTIEDRINRHEERLEAIEKVLKIRRSE